MICEIINDYENVYKKLSYGIDACDEKQRMKSLEYIKGRLSDNTCSMSGCISCGATLEEGTYNCSAVQIISNGPNNLAAELTDFTYCYDDVTDKFQLRFTFNVTFDKPSTIALSFIDISLDTTTQPITNVLNIHNSGAVYKIYGSVPNNGTDMYARITVSDGITNIDIPHQATLVADKDAHPCLTII